MSRQPRYLPSTTPIHICIRGHSRKPIFRTRGDAGYYKAWLKEAAEEHNIFINGWVLMTNHTHLILSAPEGHNISKGLKSLSGRYARYFNKRYSCSGALFEGRFKSSAIESARYFLVCLKYVELNPVRAGLATHPADWQWSSFGSHALGEPSSLLVPHEEYRQLGRTPEARRTVYRKYVESELDGGAVQRIRGALARGESLRD